MSHNFLLVIFFLAFISYWCILSKLVYFVLESPKLKLWNWAVIGAFNLAVIFCVAGVIPSIRLCYIVMLVLMLVELYCFHRDSFAGALLCTLACAVHIVAAFMTTISMSSLFTKRAPYEILTDGEALLLCCIALFLLLDIAIICCIKFVPLSKVKIINQHNEQQWFIITWMAVSCLFLLFMENLLHSETYPSYLSISQMVASVALLVGLYIVLFFSIKTSALLGYREKNMELEQAIHQEQQYRNFMVRDAIVSYEVNVTKDLMLKGLEEYYDKADGAQDKKNVNSSYSDMLVLISQKTIYSEDIADFVRGCGRTNILRLFERGEREFVTEYRRLFDGEYIWVRAIINLLQDIETGDIRAFVCVKNIDDEKKNQLALQWQAERDPLTGLYNRATASKLIDEHIAFCRSAIGSALFMVDVDNFKEINDNLGHIFGDAVLCELAEKLTRIFRNNDIVGRIGGDEYIVFLKDIATIKTAQEKAEEVCREFDVTYKGKEGTSYSISSSVGISFFPRNGCDFKELYSNADVALYAAKSNGKNGYKLYDGSSFSAYTSQRTEIQPDGNVLQKGFRENRVEYVFKMLYQSKNSVAAIHSVLELVTKHFSFERGYIFETSKDGKTSSNTFEWCAQGITPQIDNLQMIPVEAVATAHANFQNGGTFILKSLDDVKPIERSVLEPQGIKSMFQFGIFDKSRLLGFIGFDNCTSETTPSDTEIDELRTICNILATFFVKQYIDDVSEKDLIARQEVMNHLENYIYVINAETFEVLFMNEKIQTLLNKFGNQEACYSFFRGNSSQCEDCPLRKLLKDNSSRVASEIYNQKLNIWMQVNASLMRWTDGSLACLMNCTDITEQKQERIDHIGQLEKLLYVDSLTGGRTYHKFLIDAQQILENQSDKLHFLVKIDVANFKLVNQLYGFEKGDEILCCVAKAIEETARNENEISARLNNDEFVALFTIEKKSDIEKLNKTFIENFHRIIGNDFSFHFKFPHGRYVIEPSGDEKVDIHDMFEKVNVAHKTAKLNKAVDYEFYDEEMTNEALRVKEIENKMEAALKAEEFCVYLQPKYYLENEAIAGAEALVRWKNLNVDLFSPLKFISVFERNGFIIKLDFYMFEKVCQIIKSWIENGVDPVTVSVNFSRLHLDNADFVKHLCEIVDRVGVDRKYLEIEVTETVIYDNIDTLEVLLEDIHKNGFSMSMDDFGSGYSSLGMLKDFPVDVIKMDRSFFADQRDTNRSKIVVGSIIQMARSLGVKIVAEGVEEQEHINFLRELSCDMVQGYYYARPMPVDEFTSMLCKPKGDK